MKWIRSAGGPLLFLPENHLRTWNGILDETGNDAFDPGGGSSTDYDRACASTEYVELISVGDGAGIVLGDEPFPTAWRPPAEGGWGFFVCWSCEDSEETVANRLDSIAESIFESTGLAFEMSSDKGVLFDSACPGKQAHEDDHLEITLAAGTYEIQTGFIKNEGKIGLILHRLMPLSGS
jgi:Immunity protein 21